MENLLQETINERIIIFCREISDRYGNEFSDIKNTWDLLNDPPIIVNIRKKCLNLRGITDFQEWKKNPKNLYIGRNMEFYVKGATESKWKNPYKGDNCIEKYEEYIRENKLYNDIHELKGKELGCWCHPNPCHGNVLIKIYKEKYC
jgi:hypothetical protein